MPMRRDTFVHAGGFDPIYTPAYYEDVDLCLRLAAGGLWTVYEPRSPVTHARHASGGTAAAIQASRRNQEVFVNRWQSRAVGATVDVRGRQPRAGRGGPLATRSPPRAFSCAATVCLRIASSGG